MKINIMILRKICRRSLLKKRIRYLKINIDLFRTSNAFRFKNKDDESLLFIFKQKAKNKK
jgi:hypothetical protein